MRTSIVVSLQKTGFGPLAFRQDFLKNIKLISRLGYNGVELSVRDPKDIDLERIKKVLNEHRLNVPAISTGLAYIDDGLSFSHPDPDIRKRAVERIKSQIALASEFDARVIIGLVRGKVMPGISRERALEFTRWCIAECADYAGDNSIQLSLEPINRYETDILNTMGQALDLIKESNKKCIGVLADTFHMNIEEPDIAESIISAGRHINHVHVADSNRWAVGCGHVNFKEILTALNKIGYSGYLSAEILPKPDPAKSAEININNLSRIMREAGAIV